jgi:hypothetical protein
VRPVPDADTPAVTERPYVAPPMVDWQAVYDGDEPAPAPHDGR